MTSLPTPLYAAVALFGAALLVLLGAGILARRAKRMTERSRYAEQSYKALFDSSPDMVFMLDGQGCVTLANQAARRRLLSGKTQGKGETLLPFLDEEGGRRLHGLIAASSEGKIRRDILYFKPERGRPLTLEVNAFPSCDESSGAPVVCCIARDMTERLSMEKELMEAERLGIIGKMAAGIAHEVNNPLNIILTNAELMREMTEDEELTPCIQAILHNVDRAAGTIRQLLDLSTPGQIAIAPLDLSLLVRDCLSFLKPRLKTVRTDLSRLPASLPMRGDKTQLEQLLLNLLLNALAGMEDKGNLTVTGRFDAAEKTVRLEIRDSGKGIPRENLEKIFDIFFTTRNREGFGLGLFLCRRIAERHDGVLFAESEEGRGATLILELPAEKQRMPY